jgi:hypothetical protein
MADRSVYDYAFLGEVSYWFETSDELFVAVRYAHAGGDRDYLFADSFAQILDLATILPPTTDIVVFRQKQLPFRGTADERLLSAVRASIPDGADWLLLARRREGEQDFTSMSGSTHEGLRAAFGELRGKPRCFRGLMGRTCSRRWCRFRMGACSGRRLIDGIEANKREQIGGGKEEGIRKCNGEAELL